MTTTEENQQFVGEFEKAAVMGVSGRLPALTMDLAEGYTLNTHLRLELEVRVKGVRYEEDRRGNMTRQHIFAIETVNLKSAFRPEDARDDIGGSASAHPDPQPVAGVTLGRSSDTWGATAPSKLPGLTEVDPGDAEVAEASGSTDDPEMIESEESVIAWLRAERAQIEEESVDAEESDEHDDGDPEAVGF